MFSGKPPIVSNKIPEKYLDRGRILFSSGMIKITSLKFGTYIFGREYSKSSSFYISAFLLPKK